MRATSWSDEHDRLVADTAPPVPEPSEGELDRVWTHVAARISSGGRRRRRWGRIVAAGIGAIVLGTSGLAAAELYTAHTGKGPVDAEDLSLGGPGERLDPAAPDYGKAVAQAIADIPFPNDASRVFAIQDQVHDARFAKPGDERVSVGALRAWVADAALCSWSNQWAAATRDGDEAARAQAIEMIHDAPSWPAVVAIDPKPYSRTERQEVTDPNGNTYTEVVPDESQFYYLGDLGRAVHGRDVDAVATLLAANNGYCRAQLVPDLPKADPLFPGH
jgi:hypothetical protein